MSIPGLRSYKSIVHYLHSAQPITFNASGNTLSEALDKEIGFVNKPFAVLEIRMEPIIEKEWYRGDI